MHHGTVSRDIARGLMELRKRIVKAEIPPSKLDETLLLATWNIRNFGSRGRQEASLHYIAEILGQFDLIAVTEVGANLKPLARVLTILGPYWRAVFSDFVPDAGGNRERIAYLYDKRAVTFTGLAAEADTPREKDEKGEYVAQFSWWRSPYIASFRAGNFDFVLITAHIRWGDSKADRLGPLKLLAAWVDERTSSAHTVDEDIIVLGDFNIPDTDGELFDAITGRGLQIPTGLRGRELGSNLEQNKRYDQILHYPTHAERFTNNGGVLDFFVSAEDIEALFPGQDMSKKAFTFQLSDHLPLWVELDIDIDDQRLDQIINSG